MWSVFGLFLILTFAESTLDTTYPTSVLADHVGPLFNHTNAMRVRQQALYDKNGELIHLANVWTKLCPGTLVKCLVKLRHSDIVKDGETPKIVC